jgi:hypothetical protein
VRRDAVRRGVLLVDVRYLPPKHGVERAVADVSTCALRVTGAPVRAGFRPIRARDALPRAIIVRPPASGCHKVDVKLQIDLGRVDR